MGILRRTDPESAAFSPKKTVTGRFRTADNPHGMQKIRTTSGKSANTVQNPHSPLKIRTTVGKSANTVKNPHGMQKIRTHGRRAVRGPVFHRPAVPGAQVNSHVPGRLFFEPAHTPVRRNSSEPVPATHSGRTQTWRRARSSMSSCCSGRARWPAPNTGHTVLNPSKTLTRHKDRAPIADTHP